MKPVKLGYIFPTNYKFKHRKKSVNAKGSPKEVIVKVNGKNVYSSNPQSANYTNGTTPTSPIPVTTPAPQTHNINLHINLTKASNPTEEESNRPIIVAALPKPQPVVALVPSIASQPAVAPAVVPPAVQPPAPQPVTPVTTAPPEKKGESSLSKILLTAALLKSLTGSDSSESTTQGYPSALQNLLMPNTSPLSALLAQGGLPPFGYPQATSRPMGYPQLGYPQTGVPALGNSALGYPAAGANMGYPAVDANIGPPAVGTNMGYPAVGANTGYPAVGANTGYPPAGAKMGYPAVGANTGYPAVGANTGYPPAGTNMGYPAVGANIGPPAVNTNMGYPALGTNMGYPAGGNPNLRYPAASNQNMGYPALRIQNMGYPAGSYQPVVWNPNVRYGDDGKGKVGDVAGGNQNIGYPAGGTQNMAYPGGGSQSMDVAPTVPNFLSALSPTPPSNLLQNPSSSSGGENPPLPGPEVLPNLRPPGSPVAVGLTQSQSSVPLSAPTPQVQPIAAPAGTPGVVPGIGQAQGQGQGQSQGQSQGQGVSTSLPANSLIVPSTSVGVPGIDPMSSCWCGCEADCPHPCDLCHTGTDSYYNYNNNNNHGNHNIVGTVYTTNTG